MSSSTTPVLFTMTRGDDTAFKVTIKDATTELPLDVSGWKFSATMKRGPTDDPNDESAPVKVDVTLEGDEAVDGVWTLLLPSSQTRNLGAGLYYFDLQRELDGLITTVIYGRVRVTPDITRRIQA